MPRVVLLSELKVTSPKSGFLDVRRIKRILEKTGQLAPAQVNDKMELQDNQENPYSNDYYYAAKELGWKDLLVTDGKY